MGGENGVVRSPDLSSGLILLNEIPPGAPGLFTLLKSLSVQFLLNKPDTRIESGAATDPPEAREELHGAVGLVCVKQVLEGLEIPCRFLLRSKACAVLQDEQCGQ